MVRDFQSVIGREARRQVLELAGRLPDAVVACVGGGSNAMGIFSRLPRRPRRGARRGARRPGTASPPAATAPRSAKGTPGVLHGSRSYVLQDADGQIAEAHSISAGLDYPGVGPGARLPQGPAGGSRSCTQTDAEALDAFQYLARPRGSSRRWRAPTPSRRRGRSPGSSGRAGSSLVNVSGRGDKDVEQVRRDARGARPEGPPRQGEAEEPGREEAGRGARPERRPGSARPAPRGGEPR